MGRGRGHSLPNRTRVLEVLCISHGVIAGMSTALSGGRIPLSAEVDGTEDHGDQEGRWRQRWANSSSALPFCVTCSRQDCP